MYQINYRLFRELVDENTETVRNALLNDIPLTDILSKIKTLDWLKTGKRLHSNISMRKSFDIIPSAYLGLLSNVNANGTDAIKVHPDGRLTEYELKTAEVNSKKMWKTELGTMYVGQGLIKDRYTSIKSSLEARYAIHSPSIIQAKNMKTVFLITDSGSVDGYFDAWEMEGEDVINCLTTDRNSGRLKSSSKRAIKFSTFQKLGKVAETTLPLIGYDKWADLVKPHLITLKPGQLFPG